MLRLETLTETVQIVKERRHGVPIRVITNGLFPPSVAEALAEAKVGSVCVSLGSHRPDQYAELMQPQVGLDGKKMGFGDVCGFICSLVEAGVSVECAVVQAPGVDVQACRSLSEALGAVSFKVRDYHP